MLLPQDPHINVFPKHYHLLGSTNTLTLICIKKKPEAEACLAQVEACCT